MMRKHDTIKDMLLYSLHSEQIASASAVTITFGSAAQKAVKYNCPCVPDLD